MFSKIQNTYKQSGVSLFLAIIIVAVLLAIVLGINAIFIGQLRMVGEMGYSVIALNAADAGAEAVLMARQNPQNSPAAGCTEASPCPLGEAQYYLDIKTGGQGDCPAEINGRAIHYCIKSIGIYQNVRRAIETIY